jgi:hypothetical protein
MANRRGRPTLLTDEITRRVCAHIGKGIALKPAFEAEGISERVGHDWLAKGEDGVKPFDSFSAAVTRARARGEIALHCRVLKGGPGSDGARFILERRVRERYGRVDRVEMAGHDGGAIQIDADLRAASMIRKDPAASKALHDALGLAVAGATE